MKIGIMTFHRAANYGAVLQAYALQLYLTKMGNELEIMDYRCTAIENVHSPLYFLYVKGLKNKMKQFLRLPVKLRKRKMFNDFLDRKIPLSVGAGKRNTKVLLQGKYDVVIAGSDQIWNPDLIKGDMTYLLNFVPEKTVKVSYAASFGIDRLDVKTMALYKKYIDRFDKLSVREQQGVAIIKDLCNKEVISTIDPTLLLGKGDWESFVTVPECNNYILLYMIEYSDKLIHIAQRLAEKKGKQLLFISDSMLRKRGIKYVISATPEEWTGLFYHAACVVTNSFHGTAFSINFNKKVIIGLSDLEQNGNTRITSLLDDLAIEYDCEDSIIDLSKDMNWDSVNVMLDALREDSYRFLQFADERKGTI
ncbi:MAG: polysaccharide pyruvyl transferase family protein [Lachnospiraceae bacterium]|nr:polysaccharide pyruvyl transferase family protein [Lachnospiraceae bacterium]